jgi:pimeloyl-ACP methyl ester carboxylesterase
MPVVFVHGVPEVAAIWTPLLAELGRDDAITLSPPGFGAPVPDGFGATSDEYLAWLTGELAGISGPVDLIGHD